MNIDFEKIKKEYPKSYEKFCDDMNVNEEKDFSMEKIIDLFHPGYRGGYVCFNDFVEFFDKNGIIIIVNYLPYYKDLKFYFVCQICYKDNLACYTGYNKDTRPEAQTESIYMAFEIMESTI